MKVLYILKFKKQKLDNFSFGICIHYLNKTKKNMKRLTLFLVAAAAMSTALVSCGNNAKKEAKTEDSVQTEVQASEESGVEVGGSMMVPSKNIVENAAGSSDHTTLVAAVKAAELVETLSGTGPFTVFAPTNEAFNALPAGTVEGLLKPESKDALTGILTYHVVSGALKAADLKDGEELTTVNGKKLKVTIKDGVAMVGNAKVTIADAVSSNGVTHVIDQVLLPPAK